MYFGHGWKIENRKHERKMTVLPSHSCLQNNGLVFRDLESEKSFLIWEQNMEFRQGRGNVWFLVAVCDDDDDDKNDAFLLKIACELIVETPQKDRIQVVCWEEGE